VAVVVSHDDVPDDLRACVRDAGGTVVRGNDTLGALRADLATGGVDVGRTFRVGDNDAVLVTGTSYRLLLVAGPDSPPLDDEVGLRAYQRPEAFSVVAVERGSQQVLLDCARLAG
jgi:hypothetical protein